MSPKEKKGYIKASIAKIKVNKMEKMEVIENKEKNSITYYKTLDSRNGLSLLEVYPKTGRTHQIRTHFSYIKHPLFNDLEYGGNKIVKGTTFSKYKQFINNCFKIIQRQSLHAKTLSFFHPVKKEKISFSSDLPDDMSEVILKWKNYTSNRM